MTNCPYDERTKCGFRKCRECDVRIDIKYSFEGNKMWNQVKAIIRKFETKNLSDKKKIFGRLTDAEMEILRDYFNPYLDDDDAIFMEICNQELGA